MRVHAIAVAARPLSLMAAAIFFIIASTSDTVSAQPLDDGAADPKPPVSAKRSAAVGSFAPWGMTARSDRQEGTFQVLGGYDTGRGGALFSSTGEGRVSDRVSVRAGFSWVEGTPGGGPQLGVKVDLLRQEKQGLDLAVAGSYDNHGFNMMSAAVLATAVGM